MKHKYTEYERQFIEENHWDMFDREIAEVLGLTAKQIKCYRANHHLCSSKRNRAKYRRVFRSNLMPDDAVAWLEEHNAEYSSSDIAVKLNELFGLSLTGSQVSNYRKNHHMPSGIDTRFKKGCVPWTKGKTLEEICGWDPEKLANAKSTWFKPGESGLNEKPVGTITEHTEGYLWIKVTDRKDLKYPIYNWRMLHRHVWETVHGPIPEGKVIMFLNGNKKDCRLENLIMVDREEAAVYRTLVSDDPDIQKTAVSLARLQTAIKRKATE